MVEAEDDREVKVGVKDILAYVYAVLRSPKCTLKARGTHVKKAIDVGLICERDYGYHIDKVRIYDSTFETEDGKIRHISNIDVSMNK